jgi:phosphoserine aminotransferase
MKRVLNFSPGPATLPESVLMRAQKEMLDCNGSGMSVMEMSHRSKVFEDILQKTQDTLRELMRIPANYKILFLQGGAWSQFSMVPLNLFRKTKKADYVLTGEWAKKAIGEARRYGEVNVVASSEPDNFNHIPEIKKEKCNNNADYFHYTHNNTIFGTRFTFIPETGNVPLICDMSSSILSEELDVSRFGLIYAGAQKNMGPAGVTLVIIREDLIGAALDITPTMFNYKVHAENNSLFNTPPCYSIYICGLVFEWIKDLGGIKVMEKINKEKAGLIYKFLDNSALFKGTVQMKDRSLMNIPFVLPTEELNKKFITEAEAAGLVNLKGHRSVGGMRASIYNAMPKEGIEKLVDFMNKFEQKNK